MSSKTFARAGAALIHRLFISNPLKQSNAIPLPPQVSSNPCVHALLGKTQIDRTPPLHEAVGGDTETLKRIASPEGILFPCGLPSLRFFIDEGKHLF